MSFIKYQHIERLGTTETAGIEEGVCYIFPKIDGTNGSIWLEDGNIKTGSRNRELDLTADNAGFHQWVMQQENIKQFFVIHPEARLYGEWLVPHTIKTYRDEAWKKFYVFDVIDSDKYLSYEEYSPVLERCGIDYIPAICKINNPTAEKLIEMLDKNVFLIKDGMGTGEGIIIKNYDYINRFGRVTWAKIVKNEFKDQHCKNRMFGVPELKCTAYIEEKITEKYVTESLIEKEYAKIVNDVGGWSSKLIPRLLGVIFYCLVSEEAWNFIKDFGNPVVDFKKLNNFAIRRVKQLKPELF